MRLIQKIVISFLIISFLLQVSLVVANQVIYKLYYDGELKTSTFSWRANTYNFHEQVLLKSYKFDNSIKEIDSADVSSFDVASGNLIYEYVFDTNLDLSSASGKGTISNPEYAYSVNIQLLGKTFMIVGVESNQVKVLQGSTGTSTATIPVVYGNYSVYSTQGRNDAWTIVIIEDKSGNQVDNLNITQGFSKDSSAAGLTIKVTKIMALQDETIVGTNLIVNTVGNVEKIYDATADVTSTNDRFSGETEWGIQVSGFSTNAQIKAGDKIQILYKPTTTKYFTVGQKLTLPNNYGGIVFDKKPDLIITDITFNPPNPVVKEYVNISAHIKNIGNISYSGRLLLWWEPEPGVGIHDGITTFLINSGETKTISSGYSYNKASTFQVKISVDSMNDVDELNENNNNFTKTITVKENITDLCVGITCQDSTLTCPDGYIAKCSNTCSNGVCSQCTPDCSSHQINKCANVQCGINQKTCPDGFIASCQQTCDPATGSCLICTPSCAGHEVITSKCESGCIYNNDCLTYGTRITVENTPSYCDISKTLKVQKEDGAECQNNYECKTNYCGNNVCINLQKELEEQKGILQKILDFLKRVFSFLGSFIRVYNSTNST